ncbi:pseudouridine synthase [Blastocladiella britannica]|nr:pseudouridine synthase [Blastocladiella britannica]
MPPKRRRGTDDVDASNLGSSTRAKRSRYVTDDVIHVEYYEENGLRKIRPYFHEFETYAKGRWLKHTIMDVFDREFADRPHEYYESAIRNGRITVNRKPVDLTYRLKNGDLVSHRNHRHEPPVVAGPIPILVHAGDMLVVTKPASVPVHPAGRYRHNTLIHLLQRQLGEAAAAVASHDGNDDDAEEDGNADSSKTTAQLGPTVYALHRLDRLTSGVMLLCTDRARIRDLSDQFTKATVGKEYLCLVVGEFPSDPVVCTAPIRILHHKLGLNEVHESGKACETRFERLAFDPETNRSLVRAQPVTGRTHQIRVHLRHLGHPIPNDPLYCNPGHRHVVKDRDAWTAAMQLATPKATSSTATMEGWNDAELVAVDDETKAWIAAVAAAKLAADQRVVGQCEKCGLDLFPDPTPDELMIFLHAYKYSIRLELDAPPSQYMAYDSESGTTTIRTDVPDWAQWPGIDLAAEPLTPVLTRLAQTGDDDNGGGDDE